MIISVFVGDWLTKLGDFLFFTLSMSFVFDFESTPRRSFGGVSSFCFLSAFLSVLMLYIYWDAMICDSASSSWIFGLKGDYYYRGFSYFFRFGVSAKL